MKEYKITIKPYLNKRVQPIVLGIENTSQDIEAWPLYYQVIYRRMNTHFRSSYMKDSEKFYNHYNSLEKPVTVYNDPRKVIDRESEIIVNVIRYFEGKEDFSVIGLKKVYKDYSVGLMKTLNEKINRHMMLRLSIDLDSNVGSIFNFKYGTFYANYQYINALFKNLDLFSVTELQVYENIRLFCDMFGGKSSLPTRHMEHYFQISDDFFRDFRLIDWHSGVVENELRDRGMKENEVSQMCKTIKKVLELQPSERL